MRLHGSILPSLVVPMLFVAGWATAITVIHEKYNTRKLPPDLLVVAMLIFYSCG